MMGRQLLGLTVGLLGMSVAVAAHAEGDAKAGEAVFKKCTACHAVEAGKNKVGPSLSGVVGRAAGTAAGFKYSDAMLKAGLTWDDANLDKYLTDPKAAVPGNKMTFAGLKDAKERQDAIAYLKTLK
jgi:cytochrome c